MDPDDLQHLEPNLDPKGMKLIRGADGLLQAIETSGQHYAGLAPIRMFPLTDPNHWIVLVDRQGREVTTINDPDELDATSRKLLDEELTCREFVPHIRRIVWVSGNSEPSKWQVETDRGMTEFVLNDEKDIRRLGAHGVLIIDATASGTSSKTIASWTAMVDAGSSGTLPKRRASIEALVFLKHQTKIANATGSVRADIARNFVASLFRKCLGISEH